MPSSPDATVITAEHASYLRAVSASGLRRFTPLETVRKGILRHLLGILPSMRRAYITDLSDVEWTYLEAHLPAPQRYGRPRIHSPREILNKHRLLHLGKRVCLEALAPRLPALEDCPSLLQDVAHRRYLGASKCSTARALANKAGKKPPAQRRNGRLTVG